MSSKALCQPKLPQAVCTACISVLAHFQTQGLSASVAWSVARLKCSVVVVASHLITHTQVYGCPQEGHTIAVGKYHTHMIVYWTVHLWMCVCLKGTIYWTCVVTFHPKTKQLTFTAYDCKGLTSTWESNLSNYQSIWCFSQIQLYSHSTISSCVGMVVPLSLWVCVCVWCLKIYS